MFSADDHRYMQQALALAERGLYTTTPNPRVGCVIVNQNAVVGTGFHARAGEAHAEVAALAEACERAQGATAYVTLEPCVHHGRTPPCADALIAAGVTRVVAALRDPNPLVAGRGLATLEQGGLQVACGLLATEAAALNAGFVSRMERGRPWVRIKLAASLDGRTALANHVSRWITGAAARRDGHHWRARACAVMTGIGTILDDDPQLDVREVETPRQPLRVVLDSELKIPLEARVIADGHALVVHAMEDTAKQEQLAALGVATLQLPDALGTVDLLALLQALGERGINELHVEAGWRLNGALLAAGCVDELLLYVAPSILGDRAHGMFQLPELRTLPARHTLRFNDVRPVGEDLRILAHVVADH